MIVDRLILYKTPLDNSYINTLDVEGDLGEEQPSYYYQKAIEIYDNKTVILPSNRALKIDGNRATITIPERYSFIRDYNYCNISGKWFFINNITSENDSQYNPSTTLDIEWDSWANNLDLVHTKKSEIIAQVEQRHMNRYDENKQPIYYRNNINELDTIKSESRTKKLLLFAKVTFVNNVLNEISYDTSNISFDNVTWFDYPSDTQRIRYTTNNIYMYNNVTLKSFPIVNNRVVAYVPMCIVNGEEILDGTFTISTRGIYKGIVGESERKISFKEVEEKINLPIQSKINYSFSGAKASYIDSIEYSFYTPISYTIDDDNNAKLIGSFAKLNIDIGLPVYMPIDNEVYVGGLKQKLRFVNNAWENDGFPEGFEANFKPEQIFGSGSVTSVYNLDIDELVSRINNDKNVEDSYIDPKLDIYPFKYFSILYGQEKYDIIPDFFREHNFNINVKYVTNQPTIQISSNEGIKANIRREYIENSGNVSYTVRAFNEYMINNGSQKRASMTLGTISNLLSVRQNATEGVLNALTMNIGGTLKSVNAYNNAILSTVADPVMQGAKDNDLKRKPDTLNTSNYGEDDLFYQDRVIIIYNSYRDNILRDRYKRNLYLYGYDINMNNLVFTNNRYWFDYVRTNNLFLDLPINNNDKITIQNIYRRGTFRYHINVDNEGNIEFDNTLNKNGVFNNIERHLVEVN